MEKYLTNNPYQTKKLGEILAKEILKTKPRSREISLRGRLKKTAPKEYLRYPTGQAFIIGLEGDLGGGKTTFLQGFAKGLGIKEKILSPTFIIMKKFPIRVDSCSNSCKFANFYHIDCYRIKKPKEILDLGFKEIISNPKNIVAVEWADRIRKIMPQNTIWAIFNFMNKNKRKIVVKSSVQHGMLNIWKKKNV
jgi:tRNA threonylcarbamoyladenosine biosynthesis protein TsaE